MRKTGIAVQLESDEGDGPKRGRPRSLVEKKGVMMYVPEQLHEDFRTCAKLIEGRDMTEVLEELMKGYVGSHAKALATIRSARRLPRTENGEEEEASDPDEDIVRVVFEVLPETRQALKIAAAKEGLSLKDYLLELVRRDAGQSPPPSPRVEREPLFARIPADLMQEIRELCVKRSPRLTLQDAVEEALRDWVEANATTR